MIIKKLIKNNFIKTILKFFGIVYIRPKDSALVVKLKEKFLHNERSFVHGIIKRVVDSLYCHASPGTLESVVIYLDKYIKENKENKEGSRLLNLGGGTGQVSDIFREIGFDVYNVDIEEKKENEKNIKFDLNGDKELPLPKKYFDIVVCSEIIEHIENPWKLFRNTKGVLKKDGILILTTPNVQSLLSRIKFFFTGCFQWFTPECFTYHINPIFKWEVDLIAKKYNFRLQKLMGSGNYYRHRRNKKESRVIRNNESLIFIFKNDI